MKNRNRRTAVTPLLLCLAALALVGLARSEARADEVFIAGQTRGCFEIFASPCTPVPGMFLSSGIGYQGSSFAGVTHNGFRGLGGSPPGPGQSHLNNLGLFTLSSNPAGLLTFDRVYDGLRFTLRVEFFSPQGFVGPNGALLSATLTGSVRGHLVGDGGGVFIDFDNTPLLFTFNDPNCEPDPSGGVPGRQTTCGTGQFYFSVNDLAISPGHTVSLTGQFTGAQQTAVPEPATLLLLGTGLSGAGVVLRRRRRDGSARPTPLRRGATCAARCPPEALAAAPGNGVHESPHR